MVNTAQYIESLKSWDLEDLVDHVMNTHHAYLKANYPLILKLMDKLDGKTSEDETLKKIKELFTDFTDDLARHLVKEEEILFPYFKKLGASKNAGSTVEQATFGNLQKPIELMEEEHDDSHDVFDQIKELTNGFQAPKDAEPSLHFLYFKLKEFDDDMEVHHMLENDILFTKASELEKELGA